MLIPSLSIIPRSRFTNSFRVDVNQTDVNRMLETLLFRHVYRVDRSQGNAYAYARVVVKVPTLSSQVPRGCRAMDPRPWHDTVAVAACRSCNTRHDYTRLSGNVAYKLFIIAITNKSEIGFVGRQLIVPWCSQAAMLRHVSTSLTPFK